MESGDFSSSKPRSVTLADQAFGDYDSNFFRVSFLNIFAAIFSVSSLECKTVSAFRYPEDITDSVNVLVFLFSLRKGMSLSKSFCKRVFKLCL